MRNQSTRPVSMVVLVCAMAVVGCSVPRTGDHADRPPTSATSTTASSPSVNQDPAGYAAQVVGHAVAAGINPVLLMAILYNESYKPHDPDLERAWQKINPDTAFGVANMHRAAFDDTKRGRDFAGRQWEELPDDPDLAIEAAAWYLNDLAARLPAAPSTALTRDDLLALGYNAGPGAMLAVAGGGAPGQQVQAYLDQLHENWPNAENAVESR